jgi:hypothetical protein
MLCKICNQNESKYSWCVPCYILSRRMKKYGYEFKFLPKEINEYKPSSKDTRFLIINKN